MQREPNTPRGMARKGGHLKVICSSSTCTHESRLMPLELIQNGYGDIHMSAIIRRLKCRRCGAVKPVTREEFW